MNKTNFISYLSNPSLMDANSEKELKDLTDSFPYFQTGQVLYLKSLHQSESIHFDEQLKIAATHTPKRAALYYLLNSEVQETEVEKTRTTSSKTGKLPSKLEVANAKETAPKNKLETEILYSAINASITQEVIDELENLPEVASPIEFDFKENLATIKPIRNKEKQSFTDWLKNAKKPITTYIEEPEIVEEDFEESGSDKKPFFSPSKMAKKSLIDKNDFISETLANIYYAQANYAKALDAYEKLSLKFPEKKTYFASQIEIIKNKIKKS